MKRMPKWGEFHRRVNLLWNETDLFLEKAERIEQQMKRERKKALPIPIKRRTVSK